MAPGSWDGYGALTPIASPTREASVSIAEAYDMPVARPPLVPPSPPRAPDTMSRVRADGGDAQERDRDLGPARL